MATQSKRMVLVCAGLVVSSALIATAAQAQDVSFIARRDFDTGLLPRSVAVDDFNGDGQQDLAVANNVSNNVSVLLGNGDGTFQAAQSVGAGGIPRSVAVVDVNADGVQDLAVANGNAAGTVSVLLGNGDGTFQAPQSFGAVNSPAFVAVGDFNGDGLQDLAVANAVSDNVSVLGSTSGRGRQ